LDNLESNSHSLRVGYPDRVDLLPLLYALQAGWAMPESPWKLELVSAAAGELGSGVLDGTLDAAFVPPLTLSRNGMRLQPLGGWGVVSEGPSQLALLLAPQRLDLMDGGDLAIQPQAHNSTAEHLLRLLLKPYYDITLNLKTPGDDGQDPQGMRLMFGDDAAREAEARPDGWIAEDMGVAWFVLSGLPTVWEILAAPRDLDERKPGARAAIEDVLQKSRQAAREQQDTLLDVASGRLGWQNDRTKEMLARRRYTLGKPEQKALARFFTLLG
jgi:predicted solute-binding protein